MTLLLVLAKSDVCGYVGEHPLEMEPKLLRGKATAFRLTTHTQRLQC